MRPNISEYSYGYALTDELIHWHGTRLTAAPVFPSLYQEGQAGGGYDVRLDRPGFPLFLQFKLADYLIRSNAREALSGLMTIPYYRMHIRASRQSQQHEMLLELESGDQEVYYSAPAFHEPRELNDAYSRHQVKQRSLWLRPSWIGPLPDGDDHYIAFQLPGPKFFCSKPTIIDQAADYESFFNHAGMVLRQKGLTSLTRGRIEKLDQLVKNVAWKKREIPQDDFQQTAERLSDLPPLRRIAYYAHTFLDAELFLIYERG